MMLSEAGIACRRWRRGLRRFTRLAIHSRPSRFGIQIQPPNVKNGRPKARYRAAVRCEIPWPSAQSDSFSYTARKSESKVSGRCTVHKTSFDDARQSTHSVRRVIHNHQQSDVWEHELMI